MKQIFIFALIICMMLTGCNAGNTQTAADPPAAPADVFPQADISLPDTAADAPDEEAPAVSSDSNILIAYFSIPEDIDTVDAVSGASIVVRQGEKLGNTQYVAQLIQETIGGDLFRIETTEQYPLDHDPLVDQAADEKADAARPDLAAHVQNMSQYNTILLGYPNWWGDLPMPLYSFLEEYDLEGKTVIPFVTHGGSRASGTIDTISRLQPGASVLGDHALILSRNDVADSAENVVSWVQGLPIV